MKQNQLFSEKTEQDLKKYDEILKKWQKSINLVSKNTLENSWQRHFIDSAQLYPLIPHEASILVDMGSGAGFPGLVIAVIDSNPENREKRNPQNQNNVSPLLIHLIESDTKKTLFLKEVIRQLNLKNVIVHTQRIESVNDIKADVITARALSALPQLLQWAQPFQKENTTCLFLKGEKVEDEILKVKHQLHIEKIQSISDQNGTILKIKEKGE